MSTAIRPPVVNPAMEQHARPLSGLFVPLGGFYSTSLETVKWTFRPGFKWREFLEQAWFISSVAIVPTILVSLPLCVIVIFELNLILIEIGAVDLAGAGAGLAVVREIGPIVSVLVVAGAGATAMCADLGSRKIREELDAMAVLGVNPIPRLVVPRVAASTLVGILLNGLVTITGLLGGFVFSVFVQGATPGLYVSNLTLLVGFPDYMSALVKAAVFGFLAGLVGCHLGLNAGGGPKGVGDAVNQTVVFSFLLLFMANTVITVVFLELFG